MACMRLRENLMITADDAAPAAAAASQARVLLSEYGKTSVYLFLCI